jgi:hypothetical protein
VHEHADMVPVSSEETFAHTKLGDIVQRVLSDADLASRIESITFMRFGTPGAQHTLMRAAVRIEWKDSSGSPRRTLYVPKEHAKRIRDEKADPDKLGQSFLTDASIVGGALVREIAGHLRETERRSGRVASR